MRRGIRGFSVTELLVAVTIGVVAFAFILHLFRQSRGSAQSAERKNALLQEGRILLECLKKDLRSLYHDPARRETAYAFARNGIRFVRLDSGSAEAPDFEAIGWEFDLVGRKVERQSSKTGNRRFGGSGIEVRFFDIQEEILQQGLQDARAMRITIRLANKGDPEDRNFVLACKIYPPMLQQGGGTIWNP